TAIFGNKVVPVKGLVALSWSTHKDKNPDRRLNDSTPKRRSRGTASVAGTLIFNLFDEDPMRAISPNEFFHGHLAIGDSSGFSTFNETASVDLPPFDLMITFSNEYGSTSAMTIFGIDITDD